MKKLILSLTLLFFLIGGLSILPSTVKASDELMAVEDAGGVKKGHWTRNCGCKWPGQECNRK